LLLALFLVLPISASSQISPDPQIMAEVNQIKAVDNHTHVPKVVGPGEKDDDFDALPCDPLEPTKAPLMARPENPKFLEAWQKLYGYKYSDIDPAHVRELVAMKQQVQKEQKDNYPAWVIDKLGIEYMLANRVAMGRGLNPSRFIWVPFDDALMVPLNNHAMADTPDRKVFYQREEMLLERYLGESNVFTMPAILDNYVAQVITPTLEQQKKAGAVAIKFEAAYLRSLDFAEPQEQENALSAIAPGRRLALPSPFHEHRVQPYRAPQVTKVTSSRPRSQNKPLHPRENSRYEIGDALARVAA